MVWPGEVIAYNFWRVRSEEYRSRMKNARCHSVIVARDNLQMLGRQLIDNYARLVEVGDNKDGAILSQ